MNGPTPNEAGPPLEFERADLLVRRCSRRTLLMLSAAVDLELQRRADEVDLLARDDDDDGDEGCLVSDLRGPELF